MNKKGKNRLTQALKEFDGYQLQLQITVWMIFLFSLFITLYHLWRRTEKMIIKNLEFVFQVGMFSKINIDQKISTGTIQLSSGAQLNQHYWFLETFRFDSF